MIIKLITKWLLNFFVSSQNILTQNTKCDIIMYSSNSWSLVQVLLQKQNRLIFALN